MIRKSSRNGESVPESGASDSETSSYEIKHESEEDYADYVHDDIPDNDDESLSKEDFQRSDHALTTPVLACELSRETSLDYDHKNRKLSSAGNK
jgi:hypothetical protein